MNYDFSSSILKCAIRNVLYPMCYTRGHATTFLEMNRPWFMIEIPTSTNQWSKMTPHGWWELITIVAPATGPSSQFLNYLTTLGRSGRPSKYCTVPDMGSPKWSFGRRPPHLLVGVVFICSTSYTFRCLWWSFWCFQGCLLQSPVGRIRSKAGWKATYKIFT